MAEAGAEREALALLERLVRLESPSGDRSALDPLRDVLTDLLRGAGAEVRIERGPDGDHLDATVAGGDGGHVVVLGHYDTVWPRGRLAEAPFEVVDGSAHGPGVFDMKAGLVALVLALRGLDGPPARTLRVVLTADEEVGSPSGGDLVRAVAQGAAAVFALEPPLPRERLKVGRRGVARALLTVTGREAHAGLEAGSGVSATEELVDQLRALRQRLPDTPGRSVNVGRLAGGTRANVVAGRAEAELGMRFSTAADEDAVWHALRSLTPMRAGARLEVQRLSRRPAWEPSASQALAAHVVAVAARLGERFGTGVAGGAGDANLTGALGVPTVDGLGPRGRGAHARHEAVEVASILPRARLLGALFADPVPR
jgi:glutamate carboxypeptidase